MPAIGTSTKTQVTDWDMVHTWIGECRFSKIIGFAILYFPRPMLIQVGLFEHWR